MSQHRQYLADEAAQIKFGEMLAPLLPQGLLVNLRGDLGSGKTTLVRGVLKGLGHLGRVRSPTFTLMETYILAERNLCHLDLYRLGGMEELEMLGIRDYLDSNWNLWIEWPDHAQPLAQQADLDMDFDYTGIGRTVTMVGQSERGSALVEELK